MAEEAVKPIEEQSKEELAASFAAEQARLAAEKPEEKPEEKPQPKAESQTFTFTATDGTVYEGASQEELFGKVTGALNNTKNAVRDRERQIHDLRQQNPKPIEKPVTDTFQQAEYIRLLESDALKAQEYLDKFRPKPEWVQQAEQRQQVDGEMEKARKELAAFGSSPAGQEYRKIDNAESADIMRQYMADNSIPHTAYGFETAFYRLRDAGKFPTPGKPAEKRNPAPKAAAGAASDQPSAELSEAELMRMPKDQLAKHLKEKGIEVYTRG